MTDTTRGAAVADNAQADKAPEDRVTKLTGQGCALVLLTAIALPILIIAALRLSDDRATLKAYDSATVCAAGVTSSTTCKLNTEYKVLDEDGHAGKDAAYYLDLTDASGATTRIQLEEATGVWPAQYGETVTVTSWRGAPVSVSDGHNVSILMGSPPADSGEVAYAVVWLTWPAFLYLALVVFVPRAAKALLVVPIAGVVGGIALHGRLIGGPWIHDLLLWGAALLAAIAGTSLLPTRRPRAQR